MSIIYCISVLIVGIFTTTTNGAISKDDNHFRIYTCGALGGSYARELTSFFIAESSDKYNYLSMDAGTSLDCIDVAAQNSALDHIFNPVHTTQKFGPKGAASTKKEHSLLGKTGYFRKKQLNGFLVTHAHADHQVGLVISSAEDDFAYSIKPVLAPKTTATGLAKQFKPPLWPGNFFYKIIELNPEDGEQKLKAKEATGVGTKFGQIKHAHFGSSKMHIKSYFLSHEADESTAYRICNDEFIKATACILFFGDTGPDDEELTGDHLFGGKKKAKWLKDKNAQFDLAADAACGKAKKCKDKKDFKPLKYIWDDNLEAIKSGKLNTIFIECSYANGREPKKLFGHLTPELIVKELDYIGNRMKGKNTVALSVVVMHIKPTWNVIKNKQVETKTDGLSVLKDTLKTELLEGMNKKVGTSKNTVNDKILVEFIFPKSTDMIYVKGGVRALHSQTPALTRYAPRSRVAAPKSDHYYKSDHNMNDYHKYHNNNEDYGLFAIETVLVLVLVCMVGLCFVLGVTFGGGVMWLTMLKKRKEKRIN